MSEKTVEIGDTWTKKIALAFLAWARWVREHLPSDFLSWQPFDPTDSIRSAFYDAGNAQIATFGIAFDLRSPEAEAWIKKYAASEIVGIDRASKQAIRQIILEGFQKGITSQGQAKLIRPYIGLHPRQVLALENYRKALDGMDEVAINRLTDRYSSKLLNHRAMTISLTEGHTASNEGYRAANRDAVKRGVLNPDEWERYWMVTRDKRLCPICESLGGSTASLPDGDFNGKLAPLHPRCRCTEGLKRVGSGYQKYVKPK